MAQKENNYQVYIILMKTGKASQILEEMICRCCKQFGGHYVCWENGNNTNCDVKIGLKDAQHSCSSKAS